MIQLLQYTLVAYGVAINLVTFFVFGRDKYRAKIQGWRISENTLLTLMLCGGVIGAMAGQSFFRHKTTKGAFVWKFWVIVMVWIVFLSYILFVS